IGLWITFWLTWGADGVQAQPAAEPSGDAAVLRALSRPPAGAFRDEIVLVKEQVMPGQWKCTAYYTESVRLPWGWVPLGRKVQSVFIEPAPRIAADCRGCGRA